MNSILLKRAFEKALDDLDTNVKTKASTHLSDFIFENNKEPYGEKILRIKYNKIKNDVSVRIELKSYVQEALSVYVGYENYNQFINEYNKENEKGFGKDIDKELSFINKIMKSIKKNKILLIIGILSIIGISSYQIITKQKCMVWQNDRYIEVTCDLVKLQNSQHKLYKEERIKFFKQVFPDSTYSFFKQDGNANLWYGKNKKGELEYFTDLGLHPETGKTLKPITQYMIDKYLKK